MKKRSFTLLLAMAMILSILAGCGTGSDTTAAPGTSSGGSSASAPADVSGVIKIGVSGPTTGNSAESGVSVNTGIQMAVDEINAAGGVTIDGVKKQVEVIYYDTGSDAQVGLSNCEKLITSDKVDFLFCESFNSAVGIATMDLSKKYDLVMATLEPVSSAITDKYLADPEGYKYFFKFGWDSSAYGETCANTILDLIDRGEISAPGKTVAICGDETDYARSNLAAVTAILAEEGYTVVSENYWQFGATDLYSIISDIKTSGANLIFSCSTTAATGVALIRQLQENGLGTAPHMAIYYPFMPEFISQIGSAADGLLWAPMLVDAEHDEKTQEFAQKLKDYCGEALTFDYIDGYSDMMVVLRAMEACGSTDPDKLSGALLNPDGFEEYKGLIKFNPDTHSIYYGEGYVAVNAAQIQNGTSYVIYPASSATSEYQPVG